MHARINSLGRDSGALPWSSCLRASASCFFFIDFVEMMREGAKVDISAAQVVFLTLLRLPAFAELILPFAVLIGSIGAFLMLGRSSELVIVRASGLSVWQFLTPAMLVGLLIGVFSVTVYNPRRRSQLGRGPMFADTFAARDTGKEKTNRPPDSDRWDDGQSFCFAGQQQKIRATKPAGVNAGAI